MMMWPMPDDGFPGRRAPRPEDPDVRLTFEVAGRLQNDPGMRHQRITVEAQNRVVLLTGSVDSPAARETAADTARGAPGVLDVCNRLRVRCPAAPSRPTAGARAAEPDPFDEIVRGLSLGTSAPGNRIGRGPGRTPRVLLGVLAAVLWAILSVLMVRYGLTGAAVTCAAAAAVIAGAVHARRGAGSRRDAGPPGERTPRD